MHDGEFISTMENLATRVFVLIKWHIIQNLGKKVIKF